MEVAVKHIKTRLPVTLDNVPNNATMAAKYFLDICNDGTPAMVDCMREMLKAMWTRLVVEDQKISDVDMVKALAGWFDRLSGEDLWKLGEIQRLTKGLGHDC